MQYQRHTCTAHMHKYTDTKKKIAKFCGRIGNIVPKWRDKLILNNRKVITSCSEEILIFCSYVHVWLVLLDMTALILDLSVIISTMYYKRLNTEFERLFHWNPQYKQSIFVHIRIYDWNIFLDNDLFMVGMCLVCVQTHEPGSLHCNAHLYTSQCYHLLYSTLFVYNFIRM